MRLSALSLFCLLVIATSAAQETNFAEGPQYLVTATNPMLLTPLATPSLSLSGETLAGTTAVPSVIEVPAFAPVDTFVYLDNVYWGDHAAEEVLSRRLQPPNMTPEQTAWYMNYVTALVAAGAQAPLAESGESAASTVIAGPNVIELKGGPMPANLPASIFDSGVTGMTDLQSLQQRGYGLSLGEVAAYWKAHKQRAPRVLTNQDLRRK